MVKFSVIESVAQSCGLDVVSAINLDDLNLIAEREHLLNWQKQKYGADLKYMYYDADLYCNPQQIMPECQSVIVFALNYSRAQRRELLPTEAKVARYAWGKDYHKVIKKRLKLFRIELQKALGLDELPVRTFTDSVPLLERALAKQAGVGFTGKNTLNIRPKAGSFHFLAEMLVPFTIKEQILKTIDLDCGSCTNCIDQCPTDAIVDDYVLDANKCISYLTIEKRGVLTPWESSAIGNWIFGCDECQEVCPFNHTELKNQKYDHLEEFSDSIVTGGNLELSTILQIKTDEEFVERFAGSPIMRTKREGLVRNACAVVANRKAGQLIPLVKKLTTESDKTIRMQARATIETF